jgi:hypothetical protein
MAAPVPFAALSIVAGAAVLPLVTTDDGTPGTGKPVEATLKLSPPSPIPSALASMTLEEKLQPAARLRRGEPVASVHSSRFDRLAKAPPRR